MKYSAWLGLVIERAPKLKPRPSQTVVKFREFDHVRDLPKSDRPAEEENGQLEVLLSVKESSYICC